MEKPLLSLIVPVYNTEPYLQKCLNSIRNQTYPNLQVLLVDDGSTDRCPALCDDYAGQDCRVTVLHQPNGGAGSARNAGLDAALGEYVGFVDSDDWIDPAFCGVLVDRLEAENADLSVCGWRKENGNGNKPHGPAYGMGAMEPREMLTNMLMPGGFEGFLGNKLFSRRLLNGAGRPLRLTEEIRFCEDLLFTCQAVLRARAVAYTAEPLYHYRMHGAAATVHYTKSSLTELDAKRRIIELLAPDNAAAKASYAYSAGFLLCKYYRQAEKDGKTAKMLQREAERYRAEFRTAGYRFKDRMRMAGVLCCPPLFCRVWNTVRAVRRTGSAAARLRSEV